MNIKIKKLSEHAVIPKYAKQGDSGFDLVSIESCYIEPGETIKIPIGLAFEIPEGYELQIRPRSGITIDTKLRVQLGTIDSGYRGEVCVIVDNISPVSKNLESIFKNINGDLAKDRFMQYDSDLGGTYLINQGDRIAQGIITPVIKATFEEIEELSESERGENGFGSSGVK